MTPTRKAPIYKRVLIKLSGESLLGEKTFGIDRDFTDYLAREIKSIHAVGTEVAAVVGGEISVASRTQPTEWTASRPITWACGHRHQRLAVQDALERAGVLTRVLSAIEMRAGRGALYRRRAIRHMERVVSPSRRRHGQPLFLDRYWRRAAGDGGEAEIS